MKKNILLALTSIIALNTTAAVFADENEKVSKEAQVAVTDESQEDSENVELEAPAERA